jgi:hypothetical protein
VKIGSDIEIWGWDGGMRRRDEEGTMGRREGGKEGKEEKEAGQV